MTPEKERAMSPRTIRVAVAHDDFVTRTGLLTAFAACDDMVTEAANAGDTPFVTCDVVVADFLGGQRILAGLGHPSPAQRRVRVMIVADADREWQIRDALEHGAAAYLLLDATGSELAEAVRAVDRGGAYLSPPIAARLAESLAAEPLTMREEQVLSLVVDGLCNKHIATRLQISVGTVKTHVRSLFDKLQVRTRTAAAATAERRGLLRRCNAAIAEPAGTNPAAPENPPRGHGRANRVGGQFPDHAALLLQA